MVFTSAGGVRDAQLGGIGPQMRHRPRWRARIFRPRLLWKELKMSASPFDNLSKEELLASVRKLARGPAAPAADMTVAKIIDLFLAHCQDRADRNDFSHDALKNYIRDLGLFKEAYGSQTATECKQYNLTAFLQAHPSWRSGWTKMRVS